LDHILSDVIIVWWLAIVLPKMHS